MTKNKFVEKILKKAIKEYEQSGKNNDLEYIQRVMLDTFLPKDDKLGEIKITKYKEKKLELYEFLKEQVLKSKDCKELNQVYNKYISERKVLKNMLLNNELDFVNTDVNQATINLNNLTNNIQIIKSTLDSKVSFMAVIKGNAYGHGLVDVGKHLEKTKADCIGVVRVSEAMQLRNAGVKMPILILAPITPEQVELVCENNITPMVDNLEIVQAIEKKAIELNKNIDVHVKVNTGLNRYGIECKDSVDFIKNIKNNYPHVKVQGIYTHFKDAECDYDFTKLQISRFDNVLKELEKEGLRPNIAHAAGSGGILLHKDAHYDMVRCGLIMYGLELLEDKKLLPEGVSPLMEIKSKIINMKNIKEGDSCGYIDRFIAPRDSKIVTVSIGYGDGISKGWKKVLIGGQEFPVVNYCMDAIMADITDAKAPINMYDDVVIIGKQGEKSISWEDACKGIKSFSDEQLQRITSRIPKKYVLEENKAEPKVTEPNI